MCGIVGYIGKEKAIPKILSSLKFLEYRGYDSSGIAYVKDKKINIIKEIGKIINLESKLNINENTHIGLGHTRWATHGSPSIKNSHPHKVGKFTVVHNGIIENYYELKKELIKKNYVFKSDTDTEVISAFQIIMLGIIYIGYISWLLHSSFRFIKNPKDKNFAIRKYNFFCIFVLLLFDLITFLGSSLFFLSILYFYVSISFGEEIFQKLNISLFILKNGFLLILIGNSYYFGHYLLSMIFRPISIQYAPYELKNKSYIKANRKLINILNTRKSGLKLKDVVKK